uniref:Coiled-coil domain-containing protein 96 n=1 Tax=Caenorhabditis tropicalis TaxID=1561998 RepID=A0A1I7V3E7_9PELO
MAYRIIKREIESPEPEEPMVQLLADSHPFQAPYPQQEALNACREVSSERSEPIIPLNVALVVPEPAPEPAPETREQLQKTIERLEEKIEELMKQNQKLQDSEKKSFEEKEILEWSIQNTEKKLFSEFEKNSRLELEKEKEAKEFKAKLEEMEKSNETLMIPLIDSYSKQVVELIGKSIEQEGKIQKLEKELEKRGGEIESPEPEEPMVRSLAASESSHAAVPQQAALSPLRTPSSEGELFCFEPQVPAPVAPESASEPAPEVAQEAKEELLKIITCLEKKVQELLEEVGETKEKLRDSEEKAANAEEINDWSFQFTQNLLFKEYKKNLDLQIENENLQETMEEEVMKLKKKLERMEKSKEAVVKFNGQLMEKLSNYQAGKKNEEARNHQENGQITQLSEYMKKSSTLVVPLLDSRLQEEKDRQMAKLEKENLEQKERIRQLEKQLGKREAQGVENTGPSRKTARKTGVFMEAN